MMGAPMAFGRNAEIYGENEPADYLYRVVSGAVRTYRVLCDGRRQIGAFYMPGDVFGLESGHAHAFSAEAISDTKVLVIKRKALDAVTTTLGDADASGAMVVRAWWKPLVVLIWMGGAVMMLGAAVSLLDRRLRVGAPSRRRKAAPKLADNPS